MQSVSRRTWDLGYDHRLSPMWSLHVGVINRQGSHELILDPALTAAGGELMLSSAGRSSYREAEFGVHFTHGPGFDFNVSYARSAARGNSASGRVSAPRPGPISTNTSSGCGSMARDGTDAVSRFNHAIKKRAWRKLS